MATLYDVTEGIKNLAKWIGIIVGTIFVLVVVFNIGKFVKEVISPTPKKPPTVLFKKLSQVKFPVSPISKKFSYSLNTVSGNLPSFDDRIEVYKLIIPQPALLSLKTAEDTLRDANFQNPGVSITDTLYKWQDPNPPARTILYNIVSKNFVLTSNYMSDPDILAQKNLPNEDEAQSKAQDFLNEMRIPLDDFDSEKTKVQLLSISNNQLIPATGLSVTHVLRIDYFQKNINKRSIYYPYPPNSIMSVFVAGGDGSQIVEAHFTQHKISNKSSTYPIYTAQEAYTRLQQQAAYIARYDGNKDNITITNVSLGYFLGEDKEEYLIPIFVFEGTDNFLAYVPAVTDTWVRK